MASLARRGVLRALVSVSLLTGIGAAPVASYAAPEFVFKYGNNLPVTHPLNVRAKEAADRVFKESNGRLQIQIFPNNQLGGDTDMLAQVRNGGIDMFTPSALVIATLVPSAAINAVGFAFADYKQVWAAMDGKVGEHVREKFEKAGLHGLERMWDNGFRQVTTSNKPINSAQDMAGLKIRVPVSPLSVSMFKALGSAPASLQFSEVYLALQTKVVDAQENPLAIIQTAKMNEVQKYCSLTNHIWDGYWFVINGRSWKSLPPDLQKILSTSFNEAGLKQREDIRALNDSLQNELKAKGMVFNATTPETFREALRKAGFYAEWRQKFGEEAWSLLEQYVGKL